MRLERYRGHVIGWSTRRRRYLIDALTGRAIRKSKAAQNVPMPRILPGETEADRA